MATNHTEKRAAIYLRMSKSKGEAKIDAQESMCRRLAEAHGLDVVKVYVDDGISAYTGADRPGWADLLSDVQAGQFDVLLAQSEDRFTRQVGEKETLSMLCVASGVIWHTVNDGATDPATADGAFFSTLRAALARMESQRKAERQRQSNEEHALKGGVQRGGVRPFGYLADKMTPDPAEAPLIQQAYADLISGARTLSRIRTDWNAAGITTTSGKPWDLPKVEKVLRRPRNAGYVQSAGKVLPDVRGQWESIIDEESYRAALAILDNPKRALSKVLPARHLCSSIARCHCGVKMRVAGRDAGTSAYRCGVHDGAAPKVPGVKHTQIPTAELDHIVRDAVVSALLFAPTGAAPDPDTDRLSALHTERADVSEREQRLLAAVEAGIYEPAEIKARRLTLKAEAEKIDGEMGEIRARNARAALLADAAAEVFSHGKVSFEDAAKAKQMLGERFDALALEQRRALVRGYVEVTVNRGRTSKRVQIHHLIATSLNEESDAAA